LGWDSPGEGDIKTGNCKKPAIAGGVVEALRHRMALWFAVLLLAVIGAIVAFQMTTRGSTGPQVLHGQLLKDNKNDGKDNCPTDGNAGKGNDTKNNGGCVPPKGEYGKAPKGK
jgi:hypothetical protein